MGQWATVWASSGNTHPLRPGVCLCSSLLNTMEVKNKVDGKQVPATGPWNCNCMERCHQPKHTPDISKDAEGRGEAGAQGGGEGRSIHSGGAQGGRLATFCVAISGSELRI